MTQKTYGVYRLMELTISIKLGKRTLDIPFTGGIASNRGVTPATYTTQNPVIQLAIEHSAPFRNGRVKIVKEIKVEEPVAALPAKEVVGNMEGGSKVVVQVACLDDARDYLMMHFDIAASKLRTKQAVLDSAETNGVTFEGF